MNDEKVPAELDRLWRLSAESRLGRPAKLDVDRVVRAAIELADRDGLSGATLPKIAEALGVTKMSLYRHTGSKDELLDLMADLAVGPAPLSSAVAGEWRTGLTDWSLAQAEVFRRHTWLARLPISGPPKGPNQISWLDAALRVLRDTGLGWLAKLAVVGLLGGYVRSASQQANDMAEGRRGTGLDQDQAEREYGRALAKLVDVERFPEAAKLFGAEIFETPVAEPEPSDRDFRFGLDLILDGVATAIDRRNPD
ncbi:TetR/AcrR family transcriptional regulator [Stackebrandtia soli]|uniref:TetR/AcrR family transcriptional regulator n=1 Tax=Stackebrandtia soli TaxID=1892856 RepID=UPI0039E93DD3